MTESNRLGGGINNVRFFISSQGSVTPNASLLGNDIANVFVCAKESYKVVWQAGGKARFIYLPPGYNNDPCMLRHTAGCSFNRKDELKLYLIDSEIQEQDDEAQAKAA